MHPGAKGTIFVEMMLLVYCYYDRGKFTNSWPSLDGRHLFYFGELSILSFIKDALITNLNIGMYEHFNSFALVRIFICNLYSFIYGPQSTRKRQTVIYGCFLFTFCN